MSPARRLEIQTPRSQQTRGVKGRRARTRRRRWFHSDGRSGHRRLSLAAPESRSVPLTPREGLHSHTGGGGDAAPRPAPCSSILGDAPSLLFGRHPLCCRLWLSAVGLLAFRRAVNSKTMGSPGTRGRLRLGAAEPEHPLHRGRGARPLFGTRVPDERTTTSSSRSFQSSVVPTSSNQRPNVSVQTQFLIELFWFRECDAPLAVTELLGQEELQ